MNESEGTDLSFKTIREMCEKLNRMSEAFFHFSQEGQQLLRDFAMLIETLVELQVKTLQGKGKVND